LIAPCPVKTIEMAPIVQGGIKVYKAIPRGVNSKYQNLEVREEL
jgi:hypothetical protein